MKSAELINGSNPAAPVFMFGFERSGTTLLSMMVGAHPQIAVPLAVTGLWFRYARRLEAYNGLFKIQDVERLVDDLLNEERIHLWDVQLERKDILSDLRLGDYAAVVERFHSLYALAKAKPFWSNLDIATLDEMDVANRWFPQARFLHIVRDGRDVALSHETMPYGASNTLECAEKWLNRLHANLKMGAILGDTRYMVVRYEDLVLKTRVTLKRICAFIGVSYADEMLEYTKMVDKKVPADKRWLWPDLDKLPVKSKVFGWKTRMSKTKRIVFEGVANKLLKDLGYEAYDQVPKRLSGYMYELWCFFGRGGRVKRWLNKLGLKRDSTLQRNWRKGNRSKPNSRYETVQKKAFGALVTEGVYDTDFKHAESAKAFFRDCLQYAFGQVESCNGVSILDCGCGPGAWLDFATRIKYLGNASHIHYFGFDITPEMVELARHRLAERVPRVHLKQGDILKDESYTFNASDQRYQMIYAYDVVQQLPRRLQFSACKTMLNRLAPNGVGLFFDNDKDSPFGRKMGLKKFVARYLRVPLVPRYYCNAHYPPLARFADRIEATGQFKTKIKVAPDGKKRALIVRAISQ